MWAVHAGPAPGPPCRWGASSGCWRGVDATPAWPPGWRKRLAGGLTEQAADEAIRFLEARGPRAGDGADTPARKAGYRDVAAPHGPDGSRRPARGGSRRSGGGAGEPSLLERSSQRVGSPACSGPPLEPYRRGPDAAGRARRHRAFTIRARAGGVQLSVLAAPRPGGLARPPRLASRGGGRAAVRRLQRRGAGGCLCLLRRRSTCPRRRHRSRARAGRVRACGRCGFESMAAPRHV
jgi:hypothetical protein